MALSAESVTVNARPEPFELDLTRTAVLVVDMQNDFGCEGGMFAQAGIDISGIRRTISPTAKALATARRAGMPVVYLTMGFRPDLSDSDAPDAPNWLKQVPLRVGELMTAPNGTQGRILIRNTWNTAIVDELAPEPGDIVVEKHRFSGFYETELDAVLEDRDIKYLVFTGCTTSVCVESTLRDAVARDYHCLVLEDCTAEPIGDGFPRTNHEASLLVIETLMGWVTTSPCLVSAVEEFVRRAT